MAHQALIRWFDELGKDDVALAGGKGANLGELSRINVPVPPGFVITTAAYQQREAREAIIAAYQELGAGAVAVRSSATAEDLPQAAFAGQHESYLNVVGENALLDAVQRVWASLRTERAIAYRARLGIDEQHVRMAVVVQSMVNARAAGVLFTANTITGARDEIIIDGSPGLGEAVVSGAVTPDHFVLRKRRWRWRVVERQLVDREAVLPNRALRQLAQLGARIQQHFGRPQDIEWAWAHGKPFILQARPITALPSPPPRVNMLLQFLAANFGEMFAIRPYPLDVDTWLTTLAGAIDPLFELFGFKWHLRDVFEIEDGVPVRLRARLPRPTWRSLFAPVRFASQALRYDARKWQADPSIRDAEAQVRAWEARDLRTLAWSELFAAYDAGRQVTRLAAGEVRRRYFPDAALAIIQLRVLLLVLGRSSQFEPLLSGVPNKTLDLNRALEHLALKVRSNSELARIFAVHEPNELWHALEQNAAGQAFLRELQSFLDRYGHRETMISTALEPTWKDAPEVVLGIVKSFAAHAPPPSTRDVDAQPRLSKLFAKRLSKARALMQIREDTHFYATLPLPLFRRVSLEFGRRLVERGVLDKPEDVFHLTLDELRSVDDTLMPTAQRAYDLRAAFARRKQTRVELEGTPMVDPRMFPKSTARGDALLSGMPGSPGVAEGPVRVVRSNAEFSKVQTGDVLVAPYTNPSWTPLFQRVAAVVVDSGSVGSHAAIVAREYGIPAVMATITGTRTLRDGVVVRVDGTRGQVFRAGIK